MYSSSCVAQGEECAQGTPLKSGARVRLQHVNTRTWLHSHHFPSPLTQNQEARHASSSFPSLSSFQRHDL